MSTLRRTITTAVTVVAFTVPAAAVPTYASPAAMSPELSACAKRSSEVERFELCAVSTFEVYSYRTETNGATTKTGTMRGRYIVVGKAPAKGGRDLDFQVALDQIKGFGKLANGVDLSVEITCSTCKPRTVQVDKHSSRWDDGARFKIGGPPPASPTAKDGIGKSKVSLHITPLFGQLQVPDKHNLHTVRCDSASYLVRSAGCIFDGVPVAFTLRLSDKEVADAADHIRDALVDPAGTYPMFAGKTIPGGMLNAPLHRETDKTQQGRNTRAAVKVCDEVYLFYKLFGLECDEYPFKTTEEGAAKGDNRFSARPVNPDHNGEAGVRLGVFFGANRILDGEAFYVGVLP